MNTAAGTQTLSDFKPLTRVSLPGLGDLALSGLTVLVGPNSSGKSQLLQDMYKRISGEPRELVVADTIDISKPADLEPFLRGLEDKGYFTTFEDASGIKHLRPNTLFSGTGQPVAQLQPQQAQQWFSSFSPEAAYLHRRNTEFLNYFGRLLVTALFLERRLTSLTSTSTIDFLTQSPQHDLHALFLNDGARAKLHEEMLNSFGRAVWPDMSRGNQMTLKVSDEGLLPSSDDRHSYKKMAEYRSLETEGDGMKSYVATCVTLLLGLRPVCLIDEPEMCLHPPQAYNLGRFIGRYGTSPDSATFVATHSSHLLRGIIQTAQQVQIIRLTRRDRKFSAHLVPAVQLTEALSRPTLRAEAVLDGIFAQAVVVVEADGDRFVYQAAWETLNEDFRIDLHFSAVGGTGGIADTCSLYRTLKIPIAVIADLEIIVNSDRMSRVINELVSEEEKRTSLKLWCERVAEEIRKVPPLISAEVVSGRLLELASSSMDWTKSEDYLTHRTLRELANDLDRMRRLKSGGVDAYDEPLRDDLQKLLGELKAIGLFLVPVGELEEWLNDYDVGVSRRDKRSWSNAAAQLIQKTGKQDGDVWGFMKEIGQFVSTK